MVKKTPRPLFLIDENFNLNHGVEIPFLKTKSVEQNEGFSKMFKKITLSIVISL